MDNNANDQIIDEKPLNPKPFNQQFWFFAVLCLAVFLFGGLFQPGEWYEALNRAPWSPPNIAFPIAWTILYVLIAIAGHKIANSGDKFALTIWYVQLGLNALWSWVFFGEHWLLIGLVDLIALVLLVAFLIVRTARTANWVTSVMLTPYLIWLGLATSLNAYIVVNN